MRPARSVTIGSAQAASVPQRDPEAYCAPFRRGGPMWPPDVPPPGRRQCFYIVWGISPSADGEFLSERSERNERIAGGWDFKERPAANALVFQESHPRTPVVYGRARGVRRQSRPARKPHEGCLNFITAVLLNELDRLLLQGTMRLSCRTYTVGSGRRIGLLFVCRGRCLIGPRAATRGRPYEILYPFRGESLWGNI